MIFIFWSLKKPLVPKKKSFLVPRCQVLLILSLIKGLKILDIKEVLSCSIVHALCLDTCMYLCTFKIHATKNCKLQNDTESINHLTRVCECQSILYRGCIQTGFEALQTLYFFPMFSLETIILIGRTTTSVVVYPVFMYYDKWFRLLRRRRRSTLYLKGSIVMVDLTFPVYV